MPSSNGGKKVMNPQRPTSLDTSVRVDQTKATPLSRTDKQLSNSFLCNEGAVGDVFRQAFHSDLENAKLSSVFQLYYAVRSLLPIAVRQRLQKLRNKRLEQDEQWYLPQAFFGDLAAALEDNPKKIIHPWPDAATSALVLTHDVETSVGVQLIEPLAKIEEELGLRSCWNLVPQKYPIDEGLVADLLERGFELGVHGYNHDGRLFTSEREFEQRVPAMNEGFRRFDACGFRAPMVHRNLDWICRLDIEYDASCFDVDPFQAMPGGIGSLWPCIVNGIVELPYTMPQDHTLFTSLEHTSTHVWEKKAEFIRQHKGMTLLLTHPDYLDSPKLRSMYGDFLKRALESDWWHALPRDVASWWQDRECLAKGTNVKHESKFDPMAFVPATMTSDGSSVSIDVLDIDNVD